MCGCYMAPAHTQQVPVPCVGYFAYDAMQPCLSCAGSPLSSHTDGSGGIDDDNNAHLCISGENDQTCNGESGPMVGGEKELTPEMQREHQRRVQAYGSAAFPAGIFQYTLTLTPTLILTLPLTLTQNPLGTRSKMFGTDVVNFAQTGADSIIGGDLSQHVPYHERPPVGRVRVPRGNS